MKKIINNHFLEFNFILFPIWILPSYYLLSNLFSTEITFLIFLILLGETHFASTFLFYFDKKNRDYVKKKKIILVYFPILICIFYFLFGLNYFNYAVLIGAIASGIHVTRQSIGISRLFAYERNIYFEILIYFSSFLFLFIGFVRFYLKDFSSLFFFFNVNEIFLQNLNNLVEDNSIKIFLVLFLSFLSLTEKVDYKKKLVNLCGVLIYAPYCFVDNIYDAIIIGVGAHWSQYILINYKIYFYNQKINLKNTIQILLILLYALIMGMLGYTKHFDKQFIEILILIPLTGQFFHYYVDAFIWKFSVKEIREQIGTRLFAK
jgi:hypothetical protein